MCDCQSKKRDKQTKKLMLKKDAKIIQNKNDRYLFSRKKNEKNIHRTFINSTSLIIKIIKTFYPCCLLIVLAQFPFGHV